MESKKDPSNLSEMNLDTGVFLVYCQWCLNSFKQH